MEICLITLNYLQIKSAVLLCSECTCMYLEACISKISVVFFCSHLEYCKNKLHTNCHWLRSVSLDLFVQCKLCKPCPDKCHKETDICIWHKQQGCSHADCGHYIPLERRGLSCDHAADTAPSFSREKLQPWTEVSVYTIQYPGN